MPVGEWNVRDENIYVWKDSCLGFYRVGEPNLFPDALYVRVRASCYKGSLTDQIAT